MTKDSARFIAFLRQPHPEAGGSILLAVDNAECRRSSQTLTPRFIKQEERQIQLVDLQPCLPELNADAQVWIHTKSDFAKRMIKNRTMLERVVPGVRRSFQKTSIWSPASFNFLAHATLSRR